MQVALRNLLGAAAIAVAFSMVHAAEETPPDKEKSMPILLNASFEFPNEKTTGPDEWHEARTPKSESRCIMTRSTDVAKVGSASACIEITADHPDERVNYNWHTRLTGCAPGRTYLLEGWIKTENAGTSPVIVVQCLDKKNQMPGFGTTQDEFDLTGTHDWKQVKTQFRVPEGTRMILVRATLPSMKNQRAKAWFDGLTISEVSK